MEDFHAEDFLTMLGVAILHSAFRNERDTFARRRITCGMFWV